MSIIENHLKQAIKNKSMFTSVDIANKIKRAGVWVRNREVADYLRNYNFPANYESTLIDVTVKDNGSSYVTGATLYYPDGADPDMYVETEQEAISYDDYSNSKSAVVADAIRQGKRIFFEYESSSDPFPTTREVDPWIVAIRQNGQAYMFGFQHEGGTEYKPRQYIVDKMDDVRIVDTDMTEFPDQPADPSKWVHIIEAYSMPDNSPSAKEQKRAELMEAMDGVTDALDRMKSILDDIEANK